MDKTSTDAVGNSGIEKEGHVPEVVRLADRLQTRTEQKARIATAHKQIKIAFLIIRDGVRYRDWDRTIFTGVTPRRPNAIW